MMLGCGLHTSGQPLRAWLAEAAAGRAVLCQSRQDRRALRKLRESGDVADAASLDMGLLWELLWPDLPALLLAIAAAIFAAYLNVQIPARIGEMVDVVATKQGMQALHKVAKKVVGFYVAQAAATFAYISLLFHVGERLCERLRNRLFASILAQDMAFFDVNKSGEIISRITADVQEFKSSFKQCVSLGLRNATQVAGSVVAMLTISRDMTAFLVVTVPIIIGCGTVLGSFLRGMSRRAQEATSVATSTASEVIGNIRTVRAFAMEDEEQELFEKQTAVSRNMNMRLGLGIAAFSGLSNLFINGMVLSVLYYGGSLMAKDKLRAGDLMSFLVSAQTIQRSLANMSLLLSQIVRGASAGVRAFEFIKLEPSMAIKGGLRLDTVDGHVRFHSVTFAYPSRPNQTVLKALDIDIPAGKVLALCGPSGSGKSTIASLTERFYDPTNGMVTIDGNDVRTIDPSWLRGTVIGYISQEPVLFAASVFDNIRYGRPNATKEEVFEAARLANADSFIRGFPDGYDTMMGERGVTVSGGQRQRIAIARALLKDPPILILDEATSALDAESEKLVQQALDHLCKERTVIVIAHRLSTIQNADIIAVVKDGEVVEKGSHASLLRQNGIYASLVKHQLSPEQL